VVVAKSADGSTPKNQAEFASIMEKVATHYLAKARTQATAAIANDIGQIVHQMNGSQFRSSLDTTRIQKAITKSIHDFEVSANALCIGVLDYAPQQTAKQRAAITVAVEST
jgi:hypothetical protein